MSYLMKLHEKLRAAGEGLCSFDLFIHFLTPWLATSYWKRLHD